MSASAAPATGQDSLLGELYQMREKLVEHGLESELCEWPQPNGSRLFDTFSAARIDAMICHSNRFVEALAQGKQSRDQAMSNGADCIVVDLSGTNLSDSDPSLLPATDSQQQPSVNVCFSDNSIWAQRGGTTYGNTFRTSANRTDFLNQESVARIIRHEYRHTVQWLLLGNNFPAVYFSASVDPCSNVFERAAGLSDGGYIC